MSKYVEFTAQCTGVLAEPSGHAFMRDSDATKYHAPSAQKAWARTLAFLREHLQ